MLFILLISKSTGTGGPIPPLLVARTSNLYNTAGFKSVIVTFSTFWQKKKKERKKVIKTNLHWNSNSK